MVMERERASTEFVLHKLLFELSLLQLIFFVSDMTEIGDVELAFYSIALSWAAAFLGLLAVACKETRKYYNENVAQPFWAPSFRVFIPIWMILSTLGGTTYYLMRRNHSFTDHDVLPYAIIAYVNMVLLASWSWLFFKWHQYTLALVVIFISLGLSTADNIISWVLHEWLAAGLGLPRIIWLVITLIINSYAVFGAPPPKRKPTVYRPGLRSSRPQAVYSSGK